MQSIDIIILAIGALTALGLIIYLILGPSVQKSAQKRLRALKIRHGSREVRKNAQMRKAINNNLSRNNNKKGIVANLELKLQKTGKKWKLRNFLSVVGGAGFILAAVMFLKFGNLFLACLLGFGIAAFIGNFVLGFLVNKRIKMFNAKFPDAIELTVRGLRSGLPISETLGIVSKEIPGPVGEEFKTVTETMRIGRTMEEALNNSAERLNTAEFNFFCITLAIQRETGGNLAETLSNLADVLRKRAQMKLKIKAMSSESKASAYIVGSLPFIVFALVYTMNPEYLGGFFVDTRLMIAGLGGLIWMGIGVFIMAKMVNFEI